MLMQREKERKEKKKEAERKGQAKDYIRRGEVGFESVNVRQVWGDYSVRTEGERVCEQSGQ